jgi:hypothetical protein
LNSVSNSGKTNSISVVSSSVGNSSV